MKMYSNKHHHYHRRIYIKGSKPIKMVYHLVDILVGEINLSDF